MRNPSMARTSMLLALALSSTTVALAAPSPANLDARLSALSRSAPEAYAAARDALVADRSLDDATLSARVAGATFSDESWRADAMALVVAARRQDPRAFEAVRAPKGLDPAIYLQNRRAIPLAGRELSHAEIHPAVLVESALFPRAARVESPMPAHVDRARAGTLRRQEARAFKDAIFMALAASRHASAAPVLLEVGLHAADAVDRGAALALVGSLAADARVEPALVSVVEDLGAPEDARVGAIVGLGKVRSTRATSLLAAVASLDENLAARRSAVGALGNAGNRTAHRFAPSKDSDAVRSLVEDALVDVVLHSTDDVSREMTVQALGVSGNAATHARLVALASTTKDARAHELLSQTARVLAKGLARDRSDR